MGFRAVISAGQDSFGNERHRSAPRVRATDKRYTSQALETGRDVRLPGDKYGHMGATTPMSAPYDIASPALGAQFTSRLARSIVVRGDWRTPAKGQRTIATQLGTLKISGGKVTLNGEYLGRANMKTMATIAGRELLITQVIAGTLTQVKR